MKIWAFDWDFHNIEHIARHSVSPDEAEEAFFCALFRKGRQGRLLVYGFTDAGRYLLVVAVFKANGIVRVITARDMTKPEKRYFLREKGEW